MRNLASVDTGSSSSSPAQTARSTMATLRGSGGDDLAARVDLPAGQPVAFTVFAHCFTCSKDLTAASRVARGLLEHGLGVLRFDFTGLGSSDGEFAFG